MAKIKHVGMISQQEKEFLKLFDKLTYSRSAWQAWKDLMTVMACTISNAIDRTPDKFKSREEQYERSIKNLGGVEIPAQMLEIIIMVLEQNPDQDFLGKLYMSLNLGSHWKGQFFTPYNVCRMMAEMNFGDGIQTEIERKGYISVCDPCVGAGAMLIAAVNAMRRAKVNYQTNAVFVGQDIDRVVAMMAYIQLSLIGCPGYIIIGNSLTNPPTGHVLFPRDTEGQEVWITPLFMHDIWEMRRTKELLLELFGGTVTTEKTVEKEPLNTVSDNKEVTMETSKIKKEAIINIKVEEIYQHPDNPRKDLGDLTELSESIKKNGVMQNLTVIPGHHITGEEWSEMSAQYKENPTEELRHKMNTIHTEEWLDEGYTLIIGHRRCAAAKLAGLTELPCRIVEDMSQKEQVSTMLEENMQRNDLTIYEQAQGFQMMLNLGDTEEQIAEKTGFSKTTIRHRLNIAKLDQEQLEKKEKDDSFQLTLKDLYELEKVEDIETRNKILKEARDSRELIWKAQSAVKDAQRMKKTDAIVAMLKEAGIEKAPKKALEEQYSGKWEVVKEYDLDKDVPNQLRLPKQKKEETVYYLVYYRSVRVIKKAKKKPETAQDRKRKERDKKKKEIKAKMKVMDARRKEFVQNIISGKIQPVKETVEVQELIWNVLVQLRVFLSVSDMKSFFTGKSDYDCSAEEIEEARKKVDSLSCLHQMIITMHSEMESESGNIYNYEGKFSREKGKQLMNAYKILERYGWSFEGDEEQLLNGTHELYVKGGE